MKKQKSPITFELALKVPAKVLDKVPGGFQLSAVIPVTPEEIEGSIPFPEDLMNLVRRSVSQLKLTLGQHEEPKPAPKPARAAAKKAKKKTGKKKRKAKKAAPPKGMGELFSMTSFPTGTTFTQGPTALATSGFEM